MGIAMARGRDGVHRALVLDPMAVELPDGADRVASLDAIDVAGEFAVVLAVKPQVFPTIGKSLRTLAARDAPFVSIRAGIPLAGLNDALNS